VHELSMAKKQKEIDDKRDELSLKLLKDQELRWRRRRRRETLGGLRSIRP